MERYLLGAVVTVGLSLYAGYTYGRSIDQSSWIDRFNELKDHDELMQLQLNAEKQIFNESINLYKQTIDQLKDDVANLEGCVQAHEIRESILLSRQSTSQSDSESSNHSMNHSDSELINQSINQLDTTDESEELVSESEESILHEMLELEMMFQPIDQSKHHSSKQAPDYKAERMIQRRTRGNRQSKSE